MEACRFFMSNGFEQHQERVRGPFLSIRQLVAKQPFYYNSSGETKGHLKLSKAMIEMFFLEANLIVFGKC